MTGWAKPKVACRYAGVGEKTFRGWLKQGLKHSRLASGSILVRYRDIDKYLEHFVVNDDQVSAIVDEVCKEMDVP